MLGNRAHVGVTGAVRNALNVATREFLRLSVQRSDTRTAAGRKRGVLTPISLGSRAADVLLLFLNRSGELIAKNGIMDASTAVGTGQAAFKRLRDAATDLSFRSGTQWDLR